MRVLPFQLSLTLCARMWEPDYGNYQLKFPETSFRVDEVLATSGSFHR